MLNIFIPYDPCFTNLTVKGLMWRGGGVESCVEDR